MATFEIIEGAPGQGKSLSTARTTLRILKRNKKWFKKTGLKREIWSNIKFSESFEKDAEGYIKYWTDSNQLVKLRDCDIIWDEIATELDARNWLNLSVEMKRFLSQYRKRGIDIYANTQDFSMIDQRARLMISGVRTLTKIIGSRDISTTKPNPKFIWGLVMIRDVINYRESDPEKKKYEILPSFLIIEKSLTDIYDTRQDIEMGNPPPLRHEVRYCEQHHVHGGVGCDFKKIMHS
jgi:hypothetical protein